MEVKKRRHTAEFRQGALDLALQLGNVSEAARQLGICDSMLRSWRRRAAKEKLAVVAPASSEAEEMARLRKENLELRKVNQILKHAAAFFSQDHLK